MKPTPLETAVLTVRGTRSVPVLPHHLDALFAVAGEEHTFVIQQGVELRPFVSVWGYGGLSTDHERIRADIQAVLRTAGC